MQQVSRSCLLGVEGSLLVTANLQSGGKVRPRIPNSDYTSSILALAEKFSFLSLAGLV